MDEFKVPDPWRDGRLSQSDQPQSVAPAPPDFVQFPQTHLPAQRSSSCGCGCLVSMLIMLIIAGSAAAYIFAVKNGLEDIQQIISAVDSIEIDNLTSSLNLSDHPAVPTGDLNDDGTPDLFAVDYTLVNSNVEPHVVALSGGDGTLLWSTALPGNENITYLVPSADLLLASRGRTISAIDLKGSVRWSQALQDQIVARDDMARVYLTDEMVVVQTSDNGLTGLNVRDGQVRWDLLLEERHPSDLQRIGESLCLQQEQEHQRTLQCYDMASGDASQPISLGAWPRYATPLPAAEGQEPALFRLWSDTTPPTIEHVLMDGSVTWQASLAAAFDRVSEHDLALLAEGNRIALAASERLVLLNIAVAAEPLVVSQPDARLLPIAFGDSLLYAASIRQRGTNLISIVGIDLENGEIAWQSEPLGPTSGIFKVTPHYWRYIEGVGLLGAWKDGKNQWATQVGLFDSKGRLQWTQGLATGSLIDPSALSIGEDALYLGEMRYLVALDPDTGAVRWRIGQEHR